MSPTRTCGNCYCVLITIGAKCIGEVLISSSLQVLWIFENNIGDDGIIAIAGALGKSRLRDLNADDCGITLMGAVELTSALSTNQTIKILHLYKNFITVEGARLILQSAVNNGVCEKVTINNENTSDNYESDNEVQKMMTILQTRREANKR